MTKFWLWILEEDINQHLDPVVKILFNFMMLGISGFFLMNVAGLLFMFYNLFS